jgi:ribosomal protein S16
VRADNRGGGCLDRRGRDRGASDPVFLALGKAWRPDYTEGLCLTLRLGGFASVAVVTRERVFAAEKAMAVRLRLKRLGRRHRSFYRLTAMESRCPRDGRILEELGTYDPQHKDVNQQVKLNEERIRHWLRLGALPTETVANLLEKRGITTQ